MCQQQGQDEPLKEALDEAPNEPPDEVQQPFPWHVGAFDAHCHPTDSMASIASLSTMRAAALAIMATRAEDQDLVADVAASHGLDSGSGCRVVASFGWHPWFSHQLYNDAAAGPDAVHRAKKAHCQAVLAPPPDDDDLVASLPTPVPLSAFVAATRRRLRAHPHALVGEIGLDKAFRLPRQWAPGDAAARDDGLTPGGREGRLLSPHRVRTAHQQAVLAAQLRLAAAEGRPVSVHGVQAHGVLYDTLSACWRGHERRLPSRRERHLAAPGAEDWSSSSGGGDKPYPPRICLHSFSGGVEMLKQWMQPSVPAKVFVSLSAAVNLATDAGRAVPDDRILVESDLHAAGAAMDAALEHMYRTVCRAKGWGLDKGVRRMGSNFECFVFGRPPRGHD